MSKLHILFVDDEPKILRALKAAYKFDFNVFIAENIKQAKDIVAMRKNTIDVVITDERMDGLSGSEFITWLNKYAPKTAAIMLTGAPNINQIRDRLADSPPYAVVSKPWVNEQLSELIVKANHSVKTQLINAQRNQQAKIIAYRPDKLVLKNCNELAKQFDAENFSIFVDSKEELYNNIKKSAQLKAVIIDGVEDVSELTHIVTSLHSMQTQLAIVLMASPSFAQTVLKHAITKKVHETVVKPMSSIRFLPIMKKIIDAKNTIRQTS